MAQAFFDELAPEDPRAQSAGTEPVREIWPEVVQVMHEAGIDIYGCQPKKLTRETPTQRSASARTRYSPASTACPCGPTS